MKNEMVFSIDNSIYLRNGSGAVFQADENGEPVSPIEYKNPYFNKWVDMDFEKIDAINKIRFKMVSMFCGGASGLLDFGCGTGDFVLWSRLNMPYSCQVYGYDLDLFDYNKAKSLTLTPGTTDLKDLGGKFDVVTMFDSLEHLRFPSDIFSLDPRWFIVSVPNTDSRMWRDKTMFTSWRHYRPNEHIWYFDRYTLGSLFSQHGYRRMFFGYPEDAVRTYPEMPFPNILTSVFVKE